MPKPPDFPPVPAGIFLDTELYTQRLRAELPQENYRFTPQDIADLLSGVGYVKVYGIYPDDASAHADGVPLGGVYELSEDNIWQVPAGIFKRVKYIP